MKKPIVEANTDGVSHPYENCPSCRVVSSVIPLTLSAYIMYVCKDQVFKYAGVQKVSYLTLCTGMSIGLLYLGVRQLFRH
ncbi:unnamed protein product [Heterobilharzia americana]|nr:unnamed protein product [Heterobilharzia americana]CAH8454976.1 unnamed protein product [Heterobilharzia americana]